MALCWRPDVLAICGELKNLVALWYPYPCCRPHEWIITMHCLAQQQLNRLGLIWSQYWPCWCIFHLCPPNGVTEVAMS